MKTMITSGAVIDITAPSGGTVSGRGVKVGALFLIAKTTNAAGETVSCCRVGEFDHAAEGAGSGQAWAVGDEIYWDDTNKRLTKTATDNTKVGVATVAKATAATTGRLVLVPGI